MLTRQSGTKCNGYVTQCKALLLWKNALHVCFLWFLLRINLNCFFQRMIQTFQRAAWTKIKNKHVHMLRAGIT